MRILALRLRKMGDIALSLPAVEALRLLFPEAYIHYCAEEPFCSLVEGHPHIDGVSILSPQDGLRASLAKIPSQPWDLIIDFHGGPRSAWLTLFLKGKVKVGYKNRHRSAVYDFKVERSVPGRILHSTESQLNLVRAVGYGGEAPSRLILPPVRQEVDSAVKEGLARFEETPVAVHIGSGNRFRDWGEDRFTSLLEGMVERGWSPQLLGGREDRERGGKLASLSPGMIGDWTGKLDLSGLYSLIDKCRAFFGADSGPMHIAAATDTPIVALFGPNLPQISGPWRKERVTILERPEPCRPCRQRECSPGDFRCHRTILPEEVLNALEGALLSGKV